jgi:predicted PurR-regulated permease PerM
LTTVSEWSISKGGALFGQISTFIVTLPIILLTVFFFFIDGEAMLRKIQLWTPLPNKYDRELFVKFKDVSRSTIFSSLVTAVAQGIIGAIGFTIVGLPAFFIGILMAFTSLLPYVGAGIIWVPMSIYLLVTAPLWKGLFLLAWGFAVVSTVDNLIRAYIIKGKAHVHPIFVFFSILGGIAIFGFWGVVFGPLIVALAVTVLHIYELEYGHVLDGSEE